MTTPAYSVVFSAKKALGTSVSAGSVVLPNADASGNYVVATTANRGSRRSEGIALRSSGANDRTPFEIIQAGTIDATTSGLSAGSASWVRCSSTGTIERFTPSDGGSSDIIGYAEADGRVHLCFGVFTETIAAGGGGATPGGSVGDVQYHGAGGVLAGRSPDAIYVTDYGAEGDGTTDDSDAFRDAIAAAADTGHKTILVPPGTYRFASRVLVNEPVHIRGTVAGAFWGTGPVVIELDSGVEAAFKFVDGTAADGGTGATGASIEHIQINCTALAISNYAASTAYSVGNRFKRSDSNRYFWEVIKAGTTSADSEATAFAGDPHVPDRAVTWSAGMTVHAGTMVRSTSSANWEVSFVASAAGTTGGTEPTWNTTPSATTSDNGITWTAVSEAAGAILESGTVIAATKMAGGLYICCPVTVRDVRIENPTNAGIFCFGNSTWAGVGHNAQRILLEDVHITLPGGQAGIGVYTRGGEFKDMLARNVRVEGTATSAAGSSALPTDGTQNEVGILDEGFTGGSMYVGCNVRNCRGYDYAAAGSANSTAFVNCTSDNGRVKLTANSAWQGPKPGSFWTYADTLGYGSTATSATGEGLRNAYEVSGSLTGGLNASEWLHWMNHSDDGGYNAWRYSGGWYSHSWASLSRIAFAVSNAQVATSENVPNGETPAALRIPRGVGLGSSTDYVYQFASQTDFTDSQLRGGYRRVGDIAWRPDRVAAGAYAADIVVTAGYTGPQWTATEFKSARVASGVTAKPADIVRPTSGANTDVFMCTTAGQTGGSEPNWALAPNLNDTITDGTVTWTNVGSQPALKGVWLIEA